MAVSASAVKELRERTGAGMLDCKKALDETNGDIDKAIALLREKGLQVETGRFGAMMDVEIFNDGPVTLIVES